MKIIADDKIPFLKGALEPFADVVYLPGHEISHEVLINADALLVRTRTKCSEKLLSGTGIRFIATATIGFDHIDTQYCENNGIKWTNAPGCNSSSVQQYIAAALLGIASDFSFSLRGKTLGIIGVGNVGSKVARLADILGMNVLLNDPPRQRKEANSSFVSLERLLQGSDIVTVHVPLTHEGEDKTFHLFDTCNLQKMRIGTFFINSSRGEVAETEALKSALVSGSLAGAVIDVWEHEPAIDQLLLSKVHIATPHIAGYSTDGKANGTAMAVNALCSCFDLPLEGWYPGDVPQPAFSQIVINCTGKSEEEIIREAIQHTYDIKSDDNKLRSSPGDFEKLRGNYPVRREFQSYSVSLVNCSGHSHKILKELGFSIH